MPLLTLDFMTDLLVMVKIQNTVIMVIIDQFSKSLHLILLIKLFTVFKTAEHVYMYSGLLKNIVSDQEAQFMSHAWKSFIEKQSNGQPRSHPIPAVILYQQTRGLGLLPPMDRICAELIEILGHPAHSLSVHPQVSVNESLS